MPHVLVVAETPDGSVPKPVQELLTLARRLGEPAAIALGAGASGAAETLGQFGASRVYVLLCVVELADFQFSVSRFTFTRTAREGVTTAPSTIPF